VANTITGFDGGTAASVGTQRTAKAARDTSASSPGSMASGGHDEVRITSTAARLASLGQTLSALPAIDQGLVDRISQSLQNGTYTVAPQQIAGGLIQSERALAQLGIRES